jgi:hypothetical protein
MNHLGLLPTALSQIRKGNAGNQIRSNNLSLASNAP